VSRRQHGQAAIELLAVVPLFVLVGLLAWQLMAVIGAGLSAQEQVRARALTTPAGSGERIVVVTVTAPVPEILPGIGGLSVPTSIGVRAP
jgi:hypothetical protein